LFVVAILLLTFALMGYFVGGAHTVPFNYYIAQAYATTADTINRTSDATTYTTPAKDPRFKAETSDQPVINDPNLEVQQVAEGLELPTSMAFLGSDDILVLEKENGTVKRIVNGTIQPQPLLDVNVANKSERGMLGIAVEKDLYENKSSSTNTYVFVYFTESKEEGNDVCPRSTKCDPSSPSPNGNRLYRYELKNNKLVNPVLLLDLPAIPGPSHNGGAITIGPDNNLYIPIGDVRGEDPQKTQSFDGRSGILRVTQNGEVVGEGILGDTYPLDLYYAYGLRNSFGLDFDPVTGKLWDTENGAKTSDEINLVEPGFNSGWRSVAGFSSNTTGFDPESDLENFGGKGKYSDPEFEWGVVNGRGIVGPTAIKFLNSDKLGTQYQNDIFVGDVHNGYIYHFKLNEDRTGLALNQKIVGDTDAEFETSIVFGKGFGGITDLEVGPDGYLYVISIGLGKIFKIGPNLNNEISYHQLN
jgi:glucose/arabinose dehydrogenase